MTLALDAVIIPIATNTVSKIEATTSATKINTSSAEHLLTQLHVQD